MIASIKEKNNFNAQLFILFLLFAVLSSMLFLRLNNTGILYAANANTTTINATVTVNTFIEVSINTSVITFGSLDPGTTNSSASTNPTQFTNTGNSNTAVDVFLNASNFTSGSNKISVSWWYDNVSNANGGIGYVFRANGSYLNNSSANRGFVEDLAVSGAVNFTYHLSVPGGQTAGTYTGNTTFRTVADGTAP